MKNNITPLLVFFFAFFVFAIDLPMCVDVKTIKVQLDKSHTVVPKLLSKVYPNLSLTFTSSDEKVATIDSKGLIIPKVVGKTEIRIFIPGHPLYEATIVEIYEQIATESLILQSETTSIKVGQNIQLTVFSEPAHKKLSTSEVICSFSNTSVLTISNGVMTGVNEGTSTLTCSYTENGKVITQTKDFMVYTVIATDAIVIESESEGVKVGQIITVKVYANPGHRPLTNAEVTYSSSNDNIFTVSNEGKVNGISAGSANVRVSYTENGNTFSAEKTFVVSIAEVVTDSITLESDSTSIKVGESAVLRVYANPNKRILSSNQVSYSSNHPDILNVNGEGKVTGVKDGSATISVSYTENGKVFRTTLIFAVYTEIVTTRIGIEATVTDVKVDDTVYINVYAYPASSSYQVKEGTTTVKCTYTEKGVTFEDSKTFNVFIESLKLDTDQDTIQEGQSMALRVFLMPSKTQLSSSEVLLSSSNVTALKTGNDLTVTGVFAGTATVTCTHLTKNIVVTKVFTITEDPTIRITFEAANTTMQIYDEMPLTAYLEPGHQLISEEDKNLYYTSEESDILKVSERKLLARGEGSTLITAVYDKNYGQIHVTSGQIFTVFHGTIHVKSVTFAFKNITIVKGKPFSFQVHVNPPLANNKIVTVTSSADGFYPNKNTGIQAENIYTITPTISGKTTITAVSDEDSTLTASFELTVQETSTRGGGFLADGITIESGWFDCNKEWEGRDDVTVLNYTTPYMSKDSTLCWAATTANLIDWFQKSIGWSNVPKDTPYGPTKWPNGTDKANDNTAYSQS
ncbi:hypothetical protein EIN_028840, partial [Entamoeba invadens IP1]